MLSPFFALEKVNDIILKKGVEEVVKELLKMLGFDGYQFLKLEERNEKGKNIKVIYIESKNKKQKCPICGEYTHSIHSKLKPMEIKYLKVAEFDTKLNIIKKRFVCHKCRKVFTEDLNLNEKNKTISNKLEQKKLKDLLQYNLSIKSIAKSNNVSSGTVRNILKSTMSGYPNFVKNLPRVISFDEFKADTNKGKYAFILNDPIHKKVVNCVIDYFNSLETVKT